MFKVTAARIVRSVLESDQDDMKDVSLPGPNLRGINDQLFDTLVSMGISFDRVHNRYGDTMVMCPTWQEAHALAQAGPWKSMAEVVRTNPGHPDAKQYPWLCDIPFANLGGYISDKTQR